MSSGSPQSTAFDRSDSDILMKEVESVLLPKLFGHPKFRPGQREVITKVLTGYDESRTTPNLQL
jgi:superfamily II DNA helicase RecQ